MLLEDFILFTGKHTNGIDITCVVIDIFFLPRDYPVDVSQICISLTWFHLIYFFNYNFSLKYKYIYIYIFFSPFKNLN